MKSLHHCHALCSRLAHDDINRFEEMPKIAVINSCRLGSMKEN
ncbi:hypothetical protein APHACPA_1303 [Rickettsia amblyommatis str. Ac/Pa]|uniref:Uncharacterized protein n=1 Tax=Rickettsia amblyommatis str. Ac/Pa TaxID=1359164 RepID=A0A0F3N3D8_RICAM|nr:hypothetical protein APHACPA_1303 [Rickettsia amblyommatis str. Ac/Pa]